MIFLSGALVQFMTLSPLQQILGGRRVQSEVDNLVNHIIVCGFGRIGVELAKALRDGRAPYVVVEREERRVAQAREAGHCCLQGDATNEDDLAGRRHRPCPRARHRAAERFRQRLYHTERAQPEFDDRNHRARRRRFRQSASSFTPAPIKSCCRPISAPSELPKSCYFPRPRGSSANPSACANWKSNCAISAWSSRSWSRRRTAR